MVITYTEHPLFDSLRAFGLGKLDSSSAAEVLGHLEACSECRRIVAELPGDTLMENLRAGFRLESWIPSARRPLTNLSK